ncbi:flagellar basal body-associated protein FliL [Rhizobium sp. 1399]|jgi:hypothetical protein|nr:flagellar basal body-associated protein FliL [Rhizobium sp. 1399]
MRLLAFLAAALLLTVFNAQAQVYEPYDDYDGYYYDDPYSPYPPPPPYYEPTPLFRTFAGDDARTRLGQSSLAVDPEYRRLP